MKNNKKAKSLKYWARSYKQLSQKEKKALETDTLNSYQRFIQIHRSVKEND